MKNLVIRKANISDLHNIQILSQKLIEYEYRELNNKVINLNWSMSKDGENNFKNLILNNFVYVADYDNKLVGYICGYICKKEPWYNVQFAELLNLYVEENYRCFKIGTTLLNEFKNYCKNKSITCMKLNTLYSNANAINFYTHNGFNNYTNMYICDI